MALQKAVAAVFTLLVNFAQHKGAATSRDSWSGTMPMLVSHKIGGIAAKTVEIPCGLGRNNTWILFGDIFHNAGQFIGMQWMSSLTTSGIRVDDSMQVGTFTTGVAGSVGFSLDIGQFADFTLDNESFDLMIVYGGSSVQAHCFQGWQKTRKQFINNDMVGKAGTQSGQHGMWGKADVAIENYYATFCAASGFCETRGMDYWQFSTNGIYPKYKSQVLCGFYGAFNLWKECANGDNKKQMRYFLRSASLEFCPGGYSQLGSFGDDVPGWDLDEQYHTATSVDDCASQCIVHEKCGSFEWNRKLTQCKLNRWNISNLVSQTHTWDKSLTCLKTKVTTTTTTHALEASASVVPAFRACLLVILLLPLFAAAEQHLAAD